MAREALGTIGMIVGSYFGPVGSAIGSFIGTAIGSVIDPLTFQGPSLGDAAVQTSRDGVPIPIGWGVTHAVGNIIQITPMVTTVQKDGDKKSGVTESDRQSRTFAIGIGRSINGPIVGLLRVWENNKLVYDVRDGSTFPAADNTAFEAATTLYLGTDDQLPDSELEAHTGVGNTPSYRGLAYCVWNNKDLTTFGSSIPSYRFEICYGKGDYYPTSWEGYTYTQENVLAAEPSFEHPFKDDSFTQFTMSAVFQMTEVPETSDNGEMFNLSGGTDGCHMRVRKNPSTGAITMGWAIGSWISAPGVTPVASGYAGLPVGWTYTDWYWMAVSYDSDTGDLKAYVRNLTIGAEQVMTTQIFNQIPVEWLFNGDATLGSICAWGTSSGEFEQRRFRGALAQVLIHDDYIDLSAEANRNKFTCDEGVFDLGTTGQNIFGETPLVYIEGGYPEDNLGTKFIGDNDDLFEKVQYQRDINLPPKCEG